MRFTSLRRISIAGGTTTRPINDSTGSCVTITNDQADQQQHVAPDRVDQQRQHVGDGFCARCQPRQEFGGMPLGIESDAFAHQLGKQPPLVVGENGVADLGQDHGVAVGRQTLDEQQHHRDAGENGDAGDVLVDIGLVDHLAQDIGGARGGAGGHAHQRERGHIAPPIDKTLFHDEAANQDRRAIGIVGDFSRVGLLGSSVIRVPLTAPGSRARQGCCGLVLACLSGLFQAK